MSKSEHDAPSQVAASHGHEQSVIISDYFPMPDEANRNEVFSPQSTRGSVVVGVHDGSAHLLFENDDDADASTFQTYDDDDDEEELIPRSSLHRRRHRRRRTRSFVQITDSSAELNGLNYLNVVIYLASLLVKIMGGMSVHNQSWWVLRHTRWHLHMKYLTLVTPAQWADDLWIAICVLYAGFVLTQLTPRYRAHPVVQHRGIGFYFFYTLGLELLATLSFLLQLFVVSLVGYAAALGMLLALLPAQQHITTGVRHGRHRWQRSLEYGLFQFPFLLHAGYLVLVLVDNWCLIFRYFDLGVALEVAVAVFALGVMLAVAVAGLAALRRFAFTTAHEVDFVVPTVILWSYAGIAARLVMPSDRIVELYTAEIVRAFLYATFLFMGGVAACLVPNVVIWAAREFCTIQVVELD